MQDRATGTGGLAAAGTYGGQVIGRALREGGVEHIFGIYGSPGLAIEEANRLGINTIHVRHEQSAGFAADAYARCLRKPGVCFTSSAPGWTNIVSPIHQAHSTLSPVVLLNGAHGTPGDGLNTIQEGYAADAFAPVAKFTHRSMDWRLHDYWVQRALRESVAWPPGPVVLDVPRNAFNAKGEPGQQKTIPVELRPNPTLPFGDPSEVQRVAEALLTAQRPVIIAGDGVYWSHGEADLRALAAVLQVPVQTRRTARGAVPERDRLAFGGGYRAQILAQADLICLIGTRSSYLEEWFEAPDWPQHVPYIQIQHAVEDIWPALPTSHAIVGACGPVLRQLLAAVRDATPSPVEREAWIHAVDEARASYRDRQRRQVDKVRGNRVLHPHLLGEAIAEVLDHDSTVIFDSFTATSFLTDKLEASYAGQVLDAGLHQPVGHGVGMAVGAQVARPGKQVLALLGDGGFGIGGFDVETLVRYNLPAVVVVMNNDGWSPVAAGHDAFYGEMDAWDNVPGVRYDRMFAEVGCHGEHVTKAEELVPALDRAFSSGKPAVVNVVAEADDMHPLRQRIAIGDTWSRGNAATLPPAGKEILRRALGSERSLARVRKYWIDNGIDIPLEDLRQMGEEVGGSDV